MGRALALGDLEQGCRSFAHIGQPIMLTHLTQFLLLLFAQQQESMFGHSFPPWSDPLYLIIF